MKHKPKVRTGLKARPQRKHVKSSDVFRADSNHRFRTIADNAEDLIYVYSLRKGFEYVNPASVEIVGYTPEEHYADPALGERIVHPDDRAKLMKVVEDLREHKPAKSTEIRWIHKDGRIVVTEQRNIPVYDKNGELVAIYGIARDMTERARYEEKLRALHRHAHLLGQSKTLGEIVNHTLDAMEHTLGFKLAEFLLVEDGMLRIVGTRGTAADFTQQPLDGPGVTVKAALAKKTIRTDDTRLEEAYVDHQGRSGKNAVHETLSELVVPVMSDGEVLAVLNVDSVDLHAFSEEDETLLETLASHVSSALGRLRYEEKLVTLHRHAEQLATAKNLDDVVEYTLNAMQFTLGFDYANISTVEDDHLLIRGIRGIALSFSTMPLDGPGITVKAVREKRTIRVPDTRMEDAYVDNEGRTGKNAQGLLSELAVPVLDENEAVGVLNVESRRLNAFTDEDQTLLELLAKHVAAEIRRLRREEELDEEKNLAQRYLQERTAKLAESERRFRELADLLPQIAFEIDAAGNFLFLNRAAYSLSGCSEDDVRNGLNVFQVMVAKDRERAMRNIKRILAGETSRGSEYEFQRKDGSVFPALVHSTAITRDGKAVGLRGIAIDMTERRQMEERLLRAERLAAIGETAAMVGHDLRNPLQGITAATYALQKQLSPQADSRIAEMLDLISRGVEYSNKIVADLLEYASDIELETTETSPRSLAEETLRLIQIPGNIAVENLTAETPRISVDARKMQRVFTNLIENAIYAMPNGGKITLTSHLRNRELVLQFVDTGTGIPNEVLRKLWSPLQTTKAKGIGLGLAICKRIIEAHEGSIMVESVAGKGTTVTIILPAGTKGDEMN